MPEVSDALGQLHEFEYIGIDQNRALQREFTKPDFGDVAADCSDDPPAIERCNRKCAPGPESLSYRTR